MKIKFLLLAITLLLALFGVVYVIANLSARGEGDSPLGYGGREPGGTRQENEAKDGKSLEEIEKLLLPFRVSDIDAENGIVNPIGIVRFSKDLDETGHPGIDIPLEEGSPIYAVSDGPIIEVKSAGDEWDGQGIWQLLATGAPGEGVAFIYEHVSPLDEIVVGAEVIAGQLIATKTPPTGFTAHFQLSEIFNDYQYTTGAKCWPDFLDDQSLDTLINWWEGYRRSETLLNGWASVEQEGQRPFAGLLDEEKFPYGPKLCYELGTDVR